MGNTGANILITFLATSCKYRKNKEFSKTKEAWFIKILFGSLPFYLSSFSIHLNIIILMFNYLYCLFISAFVMHIMHSLT